VLLAISLTLAPALAFPEPPKDHAQALASLSGPDAAVRAEAIVWLANRGTMADAPLLHERLRDDSETVREFAEQGLWLLWSRSGDAEIDRRMARGTDEMQSGRLADSVATFSEIIGMKPAFAEGWNRRATAYYLAGEYQKSIADCAEVLKRNPQHFGALSGLGQIYFKLEDYERSLAWFRRALEVNPNMDGVRRSLMLLEHVQQQRRQQMI